MPIPGAVGPNVSFGLSAAKALEDGKLDGFWANGMGCEVALRRGVGKMVLDIRRGDGPPSARHYTFSALIATENRIQEEPDFRAGCDSGADESATRLKRGRNSGYRRSVKNVSTCRSEIDRRARAPRSSLLQPAIPEEKVESMNRFAQQIGLLSHPVGYDRVVATQLATFGTNRCKTIDICHKRPPLRPGIKRLSPFKNFSSALMP